MRETRTPRSFRLTRTPKRMEWSSSCMLSLEADVRFTKEGSTLTRSSISSSPVGLVLLLLLTCGLSGTGSLTVAAGGPDVLPQGRKTHQMESLFPEEEALVDSFLVSLPSDER